MANEHLKIDKLCVYTGGYDYEHPEITVHVHIFLCFLEDVGKRVGGVNSNTYSEIVYIS